MDLSTLHWEAIHTNKTVTAPNYADINRATLQKVRLFKKRLGKEETILELERPEGHKGKWLISWRMRTQLVDGQVSRRFWLFGDRTSGAVTRVSADGAVEMAEGWQNMPNAKAINISRIDET